jgi:hypothetical protein
LLFHFECTGKEAILTIYKDGTESEEVHLYSLKTKSEMHSLFQEKGFQKKSEEVIKESLRLQALETQLEKDDLAQPMISKLFWGYGFVAFMAGILGILARSRGKKQRRAMNLPVVRVQM